MGRLFKLSKNETNVRTEILAGVTTFLTMAYIIFVQLAVLSGKCLAPTREWISARSQRPRVSRPCWPLRSWLCTRVTRSLRRRVWVKIFFVFSAIPAATAAGFANSWQVALGVVFVSGVLFLILSVIGLRELIFNSVSPSMKNGIAAGIGLFIAFIAFIGLRQAVGLSAQNRFAADARWHHRGG
jgi:AGZA family xanthine/uracil permease-like MFS transporter